MFETRFPIDKAISRALARVVLPPDEQRALAQAAATGDEEARGKLVEVNLRGVAFLAHRMARTYTEGRLEGDFEDLFAIGCEGVCKAVRSLPADHPHPGAFLLAAARQSLRKALRGARRLAIRKGEYVEPDAEPDAETQERTYQLSVLRSLLRDGGVRGMLSSRQAAVVELTAQGLTQRETGERLGVSEWTVNGELRAAIATLRKLREAAGC